MRAFPRASDCKKVRHIGIETEINITAPMKRTNACKLEQTEMARGLDSGSGSIEWRTIPISVNSLKTGKGTQAIKEYFDVLKPGTQVGEWGGTHIHISILDKDNANLEANVLALTQAFYECFQKVAGRRSRWASAPSVSTIEQAKARVARMRSTRGRTYARDYLMVTPSRYQTLEFRGPVGSNDADEILAWAQFLENVVNHANKDNIDGIKFGDLLSGKRIKNYVKKLEGWRKLTKTELNKTLNVNALA